ncbi:hypothetical protein [Brevibacillus porteri]|uniref:hypothetical protein n=1 Tax=Brevibacillus porteri TaxID=2126350 RepID=UPI003D2608FD
MPAWKTNSRYELMSKLPPSDSREVALQYTRYIVGYYECEGIDSLSIHHRFAKNMILWLEHIGHKIVYWGGIGHSTFFMEGALADRFDIIIHTYKITPAQVLE